MIIYMVLTRQCGDGEGCFNCRRTLRVRLGEGAGLGESGDNLRLVAFLF